MSKSLHRTMLLMEIARLQAVLLEDRMNYFREQHLPRILKMLPALYPPHDELPEWWADQTDDLTSHAEWVMQKIIAVDPDPARKHANWLLIQFVKGNIRWEDFGRIRSNIAKFMAAKKAGTIPKSTNIEQMKSPGDLAALLTQGDSRVQEEDKAEYDKAVAESEVHYDGSDYLILTPHSKYAACYFGRPTEWCTAYGDPKGKHPDRTENQFRTYYDEGPFYVIIDKSVPPAEQMTGGRWQYHPDTDQFMDVFDRRVQTAKWEEQHPRAHAILQKVIDANPQEITGEVDLPRDVELRVSDRGLSFWKDGERLNIYARDKDIFAANNRTGSYNNRGLPKWAQKHLPAVLTQLGYTGGAPLLRDADIWFSNGRWGKFNEVATKLFATPNGRWLAAEDRDGIKLELVDSLNLAAIRAIIVKDPDGFPEESDFGGVRPGDFVPRFFSRASRHAPDLMALLLHEKRIKRWPHISRRLLHTGADTWFNLADFPKPMLVKLLDQRPELGDVPSTFKAFGDTENVRQRLSEEWKRVVKKPIEWAQRDGQTVIKLSKDHENLGKLLDWHATMGLMMVLDRLPTIMPHDTATESDLTRLLTELKQQNWRWFEQIAKRVREDFSDKDLREALDGQRFDPRKVDHVVSLILLNMEREIENPVLDCATAAVRAGRLAGAKQTKEDQFIKELAETGYIGFKVDDGYTAQPKDIGWPCAIMTPVEGVVNAIRRGRLDEFGQDDFDPFHYFDVAVDAKEPPDGWDGYSEEAAQETFEDLIHKEVVDRPRRW